MQLGLCAQSTWCIVYGDKLGVVGSVSLDQVSNSVGVIHVNRLGVVSYGTRLTQVTMTHMVFFKVVFHIFELFAPIIHLHVLPHVNSHSFFPFHVHRQHNSTTSFGTLLLNAT